MRTLYGMVLRTFLPVLALALVFFILILQLVDLFTNLWRYLSYNVGMLQIAYVALLYLPKCVSYAIPVALLFAVSFTLGSYYTNNELISVFGSGISLHRFVLPFLFIGLALSIGGYFFDQYVVIETYKEKNTTMQRLLNQKASLSNTNITVLSQNGFVIYHADYYNDDNKALSNVIVIIRNDDGSFSKRIDAEWGEWRDSRWVLHNCRVFNKLTTDYHVIDEIVETYTDPLLYEAPLTFQKTTRNVDEMKTEEALEWINSLKRAGLPYKGSLTEYYKRFAFAMTPLIVAFISSALGSRFKKNILLMSLLLSLVLSVMYYVTQMVTILLAKLGYIHPVAGAWTGSIFFVLIGIGLLNRART